VGRKSFFYIQSTRIVLILESSFTSWSLQLQQSDTRDTLACDKYCAIAFIKVPIRDMIAKLSEIGSIIFLYY
jgi:hypothetical protein